MAELDLSDAELLEVLKNHGVERRSLMKAVGVGAGVAALGGTAVGAEGRDARVDEVFGAAYSADDAPPRGLVDHEVELKGPPAPGAHDGFPMVDTPEDGDFVPDSEAEEFFFEPVGLHVEPGDGVQFTVVEDHVHTASAFEPKYEGLPPRIPGAATPFTSPPIAADESWLYRFETTGVYDVACLPHFPLGMVMRVVVFDPKRDDPADLTDWGALPDPPGPTDPFANAETVLTDAALDPGEILDAPAGAVAWGDLSL